MLGADPSQSGPRFIILSGDSRLRLTLRRRAHYGICDFFCVPTVLFQTLHVFFVIRLANREILHIAVTRRPTADWAAQQIVESCAWDRAPPRFLIRDRDRRQACRKIAAEPFTAPLHDKFLRLTGAARPRPEGAGK